MKNSLSAGILNSLEQSIAAEISSDYLDSASQLLAEGAVGDFDHVPAAVLAGAVLENHLRQMCLRHEPVIPVKNGKGSPLTLDPLITELKRAGVVNSVLAKHLQAWAGIRNSAAHGHFDEFTRNQVKQMIEGIAAVPGRGSRLWILAPVR